MSIHHSKKTLLRIHIMHPSPKESGGVHKGLDIVIVDWKRTRKQPSHNYFADEWLKNLLSDDNLKTVRVSRYAFDIAETIRGGDQAFRKASLGLAEQVRVELSDATKVVFIAFSVGCWIVQDTYAQTPEVADVTAALIFIGVPPSDDGKKWEICRRSILKYLTGHRHKDKEGLLSVETVQDVESCFKRFLFQIGESKPEVLKLAGQEKKLLTIAPKRRATGFSIRSSDSATEEREESGLYSVAMAEPGPETSKIREVVSNVMRTAGENGRWGTFEQYREVSRRKATAKQESNQNETQMPLANLKFKQRVLQKMPEECLKLFQNHMELALTFYKGGDLQYARTFFAQAFEEAQNALYISKPQDLGLWTARQFEAELWIAKIDLQLGNIAQASQSLAMLEQTSLKFPRDRDSFTLDLYLEASRWRAVGLLTVGDYGQAKSMLLAIDKCYLDKRSDCWANSEYVLVQRDLGLAWGYLGHYDEARRVVKDARKNGTKRTKRTLELTLQDAAATVSMWSGDYDSAQKEIDSVLIGFVDELGRHHLKTLESLKLKAHVLVLRGQFSQAEELCQATLVTMRDTLGERHPTTLGMTLIFIMNLRAQGRFAEAQYSAIEIRAQIEAALGPYHPQNLEAMAELASVEMAMGNMHEAESIMRDVIDRSTKILDPCHPSALKYRVDLIDLHRQCGNADGVSQELYDVLLKQRDLYTSSKMEPREYSAANMREIAHSIVDDLKKGSIFTLPWLLYTLQTIALVQRDTVNGDLFLAETILEAVHSSQSSDTSIGPIHEDTLTTALDYAIVLRRLGHFQKSISLNSQVLHARLQSLGDDHPSYLTAKHELAMTKFSIGQWESGDFERASVLRTQIQVLGLFHPDTLKSQLDCSTVFQFLGRNKEAEFMLRRVLDQLALRTNSKMYQFEILRSKASLGLVLCSEQSHDAAMGLVTKSNDTGSPTRCAEAIELLKYAVKTWEGIRGSDHPSALRARHDLALVYHASGDMIRSESELKNIQKQAVKLFGEQSPLYILASSSLASTYFTSKRNKEALKIQSHILDICEIVYKKAPLKIAEYKFSLAQTLQSLGLRTQGAAQMQGVLATFREIFGEKHQWVQEMELTAQEWV